MSLNYDTTKCNPPTPSNDEDKAVRDALVFHAMFIGLSEITTKNYKEFYRACPLPRASPWTVLDDNNQICRERTPNHTAGCETLDRVKTNASNWTIKQYLSHFQQTILAYASSVV